MKDNGEPLLSRELMEQAQAGDGNAFRLLVERSKPHLEALAYLRLGPRLRRLVEVDDVLQETYIRVSRLLGRFRYESPSGAIRWLDTLCENVIKDIARYFGRKMRNGESPGPRALPRDSSTNGGQGLLDLLQGPTASPSRMLQRYERFERLERILNALSPEYREILLTMREIASRMGRSEGAVAMLLKRALDKFREAFGSTDSWHLPSSRLLDLLGVTGTSEAAGEGVTGGNGSGAPPPPPPPQANEDAGGNGSGESPPLP
jgi:RNA polymerase sigma factor (sigma-70 family)